MKVSEALEREVQRAIPPVVYLHEQSPEKLQEEVDSYVFTHRKGALRSSTAAEPGVHEVLLHLVGELQQRCATKEGVELPAIWVSGPFGSGKSSFAKLFALSLSGVTLPSGASVAERWLARDEAIDAKQLRQRWEEWTKVGAAQSVIFDLGTSAREGESIAALLLRQVCRQFAVDLPAESHALSVSEVVDRLERLLAPAQRLFLVFDEAEAYLRSHESQLLVLQSLISELGQRLRGRVWLVALGPTPLEVLSPEDSLARIASRFPPALRIHLAKEQASEVVAIRLLRKTAAGTEALRNSWTSAHALLRLHAFECAELDEESFLAAYPFVPGMLSLLQLRSIAATQHAGTVLSTRGLLQWVASVLREEVVRDAPLGTLVTLAHCFDGFERYLLESVRQSVAHAMAHPLVQQNAIAQQLVRCLALVEGLTAVPLINDEFLARVLYPQLGALSLLPSVRATLEQLLAEQLVAFVPQRGYQLLSEAGRAWQAERSREEVSSDRLLEAVGLQIERSLQKLERPRWMGCVLVWKIQLGMGDPPETRAVLGGRKREAEVRVHIHAAWNEAVSLSTWLHASQEGSARTEVHWLPASFATVLPIAREWVRAQRMLDRYRVQLASLSVTQRELFFEEEAHQQERSRRMQVLLQELLLQGTFVFRGASSVSKSVAATAPDALLRFTENALPVLYANAIEVSLSAKEWLPLLQPELAGASPKLIDALGILEVERSTGALVPRCAGAAPVAVLQELERSGTVSGEALLECFTKPPYGWSWELVKACVAGLFRAGKIRVQPALGVELATIRAAGVLDVFGKEREFRTARFYVAGAAELAPRDRSALCRFAREVFEVELDRDPEPLAEGLWGLLVRLRGRVRLLLARGAHEEKEAEELDALSIALEQCLSSRSTEQVLQEVKRNVSVLRAGVPLVALLEQQGEPAVEGTDVSLRVLRRTPVQSEEELERLLRSLREEAMAVLRSGGTIRFR